MKDIRIRPLSAPAVSAWRTWLPQVLVFIFLLATLVSYIIAPFLALDWISVPFAGAFVDHLMAFDNLGPTGDASAWSALNQGLNSDYRLLAVDGQPVRTGADFLSVLRAHAPGDIVNLQVQQIGAAAQAGTQTRVVVLSHLPVGDQITYFFIPYLIGLIYLGSAVWVFVIRRFHPSGRSFAMFGAGLAAAIGLMFDMYTSHFFTQLWMLSLSVVGASMVHMALYFPHEAPILRRYRWAGLLPVVIAVALFVNSALVINDYDHPLAYVDAWRLQYSFIGLGFLFMIGWVLFYRGRPFNVVDRGQIKLVALAGLVSFTPLVSWLVLTSIFQITFTWLLFLPLAVFPLVAGYTVQRYRMLQADYILSRGLLIGLLSVLIAVLYALLTTGFSLILGQVLSPGSPFFTGLIFFLLALAFTPLRASMQRSVDHIFFRGKRVYQDRLQTFSGELTLKVDLPGILAVLRRYIHETLAPAHLHIYVHDTLSDQYAAAPDDTGQSSSELRFSMSSGLVARLSAQRASLLINEYDTLPVALEVDRPRLMLLGAFTFVPLPGRQRLLGWLALGPRLSGETYTGYQISFLESLCDQAALAIERAQVMANMEYRVREMNVLSRVAQGVNITLSLDDILELVYAQTTQILPARDFHIMLYDGESDVYQFAFYLENDDRVSRMENVVIPAGQALEQEVIRQRRPILTDDYTGECQRRGIIIARSSLVAWLGVPLNAGAESIGALSLSSSDVSIEYTPEQQKLLQAIADQVSSAIVKARLLQESQRRTRQLTTLNEVTRQLTSTLETEPLLQSILQSAVDILNCEAGSLLLIDSQTDELVFRSVVGPVASGLMGQRIPADRGVAGKSVKTREPIIVNDVSQFPEWFPAPDKQTGFVTRAILVIPMMVKDRVIGVIEVLNKCDGTIFSRHDQDLLAAFASQAAVAMENARLYTNTDQALAARVEELSVMQRIDRELNTSLDTTRAMRITLEWAMRQSGAAAGMVGVLPAEDTGGLQVMASQGYSDELEAYSNSPLPTADFHLLEAITGGLPVRRAVSIEKGIPGLLRAGRSQAMIPIRRETTTIGLLVLESSNETTCTEETMNFLVRLSDHASIAISNAQLYAAVQQANLAKSDFVAFVAHELKNPMTSVKGYTELISTGAVGPITEMQANFLGTIRANIERMNTLVSDLNDMAKIEVGRLRLDYKALNLSEAMEEVVRSIKKQMEEKQQTLVLNLPADLPKIWADRVRLVQVLVNLVSNAHKYTPASGCVEISAERCQNQWDPSGAAEVVHIWVKDNGIGIAEEDQKKIFQKFFRSDDPKTREVTGTGLGLNITKSLIEMQGGQVWFESEFRKGTTFHFTVPLSE